MRGVNLYRVADDSGFIGIFDPHAYVSFVSEDWINELASHFTAQMYHYRLLLWATGCENIWKVEVRQEASADFVIELVKTDQPSAPWAAIPGNHDLI